MRAASCTSRIVRSAFGASLGFTSSAIRLDWGTSSESSSTHFGVSSGVMYVTPVTLPPGRARLATKPSVTGSPLPVKTMGIVEVAFFAGRADPPVAAITSTLRATRSAANAGSRS